jgi:cytochrome bd-type quinol oxidase subunit 1
MRTVAVALGVLLVLGGAVWIAQGLNLPFAPRSFMTADRTWIVLGFLAVAVGAATANWGRRRWRAAELGTRNSAWAQT